MRLRLFRLSALSTIVFLSACGGVGPTKNDVSSLEPTSCDYINDFCTYNSKITSGSNDAEEANRYTQLGSSTLELGESSVEQLVGLRFTVPIVKSQNLLSARLLFYAKGNSSRNNSYLYIFGNDVDNAASFINGRPSISNRVETYAGEIWTPLDWTSGKLYAVDVTRIVREIISRPGWRSGNKMAFMIQGSGTHKAYSYESNSRLAPSLYIQYGVNVGAF